jgi:1-deoxy-D-xylulose-5-phosphate synthase
LGTRLEEAEKAADEHEAKGLSTTVADLRFANRSTAIRSGC